MFGDSYGDKGDSDSDDDNSDSEVDSDGDDDKSDNWWWLRFELHISEGTNNDGNS